MSPSTSSKSKSSQAVSLSSEQSLGFEAGDTIECRTCNRLFDIVQIAMLCRQHKSILLAKVFNGLYFPFSTITTGETVYGELQNKLKDLIRLLSITKTQLLEPVLVDLVHLQIPPANSGNYLCRYTFRVDQRTDGACICANAPRNYAWEKYEVESAYRQKPFWGYEPVVLLNKILTQPTFKENTLQEVLLEDITKYMSETLKNENHPVSALLAKLNYKEEDIYRIYLDYLNCTYPSLYMSQLSLHEYMVRSNGLFHYVYTPDRLLGSFQIDPQKIDSKLTYIDFDEFLFGLLFIDLDVPHQSPWADIRASYIFRYYSSSKTTLDFEDLLALCKDVEATYYKNGMNLTPSALRQVHENDTTQLWTQAGLVAGKRDKGGGLSVVKFANTCEKMAKQLKYYNLDNCWRLQKPLLYYQQRQNILANINMGRNELEIFRTRRAHICVRCQARARYTLAEHTIKVFYNGAIIEVFENEKWINELKRNTKRMRAVSNLFFQEDYFPNTIIEVISDFVESGLNKTEDNNNKEEQSNTNKIRRRTSSDKVNIKWGSKFIVKYINKIVELFTQVESMLAVNRDGVLRIKAPCVLISDFNTFQLPDLCLVDKNISQLVSISFPLRYLYIINWSDLNKNGLELLFFWVANKALMPEKHHLLLIRADTKRKEMARSTLQRQCESILNKDQTDLCNQLVEVMLKLLNKLPRAAIIDEVVWVVSEVDHVGDVKENLDKQLSACMPPSKSNAKRKGKKQQRTSEASESVSKSKSKNCVGKGMHILYTTTEQSTRRVLNIRTPDETLIRFQPHPVKLSLAMLEGEKIRALYIG